MNPIPAEYVAELYRQSTFLSAVLGGFAVAFLGALLTINAEQKIVNWIIRVSALAATLLIVATFGSFVVLLDIVRLGLVSFDWSQWPSETLMAKQIADFSCILGMYTLVVAVGLSGKIRNKQTGRVTMAIGLFGLVLLTVLVIGIVS